MIVSCPACHAELTLDVLLPLEEARVSVGRLLEHHMGLGSVAMRYIGLFRPAQRRMSIERMCRLVAELLPDIERRAITRKSRDWSAPPEVWRQAMETVLGKRDKGTLTLPLTGHGLLYEVICGLADKSEAERERLAEEERRNRREAGPAHTAPRALADVAQAIGLQDIAPPAPRLPPPPDKPSRMVLEKRREMEERARRMQELQQAQQGPKEPTE